MLVCHANIAQSYCTSNANFAEAMMFGVVLLQNFAVKPLSKNSSILSINCSGTLLQ